MKKIIFLIVVVIISIQGCVTPTPEMENESITTVKLLFESKTEKDSIIWEDKDGNGSALPTVVPDVFSVKADILYDCNIVLRNILALTSEGQNVTAEIFQYKDEHLFIYDFLNSSDQKANGVTSEIKDFDSNNKPLGLKFNLKVNKSSDCKKVRIRLVHFGSNPKTSTISDNASTDVDIYFNLQLK